MLIFSKKLWVFVKERIPSYFFFLELSCSRAREPWQHAQFFLTSPHFKLYYSQSFHILRQKTWLFLKSICNNCNNKIPHTLLYIFSENQKIKKKTHKQKSSPRDKDEWCFDHKTLYLEKQKTKNENLYFGQLPQDFMKKSDSQMSHFRSLFFRAFVKVSLKVTLKTKQKIKPHFAYSSYWVNV